MIMLPRQILWLRAAMKIAAQYRENAARLHSLKSLPTFAWDRVERWERLYQKASRYQYQAAMRICRERLQQSFDYLFRECSTFRDELIQSSQHEPAPSLNTLYAELCALPNEFESVEIDWDEQEIVVLTQSVVLENIDLGTFEIRFRWSALSDSQPYRIISMAQTGEDDVHHPHVQADTLCEGEGKIPLKRALTEGRLCDFFLLIQQVLQTYNSGSAYVSLCRWFNVVCADCGDSVSREDVCSCTVCEHSICDCCLHRCSNCGEILCASCTDKCNSCDETYCRDCLSTCDTCCECFCRSCLCSEICPACLEESEEEDHAPSEDSSIDSSPVAPTATETSASQEAAFIEV